MYVNVVMRSFDGREVDGNTYFNNKGLVNLPNFEHGYFFYQSITDN